MKRSGVLMLMAVTLGMSSCKKEGCTDPTAKNYDSEAKKDDGTCEYAAILGAKTLDCEEFSTANTSYELPDLGLEVDYIVTCKMEIRCDLKIMPGVTIAFKTDAGLAVESEGSLNAIGTLSTPIIFTGVDKEAGSWAGIYIESADSKNKINFCKVEYAGGDRFNSNGDKGAFILWADAKAEISNTTISNSAEYGINANYRGGSFTFNNNTITSCSMPMFICGDYAGFISGGNFTGNAIDAIFIDTYSSDGDVQTPQTWSNLNVPYRVKGGGVVTSQSSLVIAPGVVMEFEAGSGLRTAEDKSIKAVGTSSEKIIFRGVNPGPGAWKNIYFYGTNSLNEIGHAIISGGGEDPATTQGSVYLWYNAKLNIHDVEFKDNLACAVFVRISGTTPNPNYTSSNLTFSNNTCDETMAN